MTLARFTGLKARESVGFELFRFSSTSDGIIIKTDGSNKSKAPLLGAQLDFFDLYQQEDAMVQTMSCVKNKLNGKQIIGAVIFPNLKRGPSIGHMMQNMMSDALFFQKQFLC